MHKRILCNLFDDDNNNASPSNITTALNTLSLGNKWEIFLRANSQQFVFFSKFGQQKIFLNFHAKKNFVSFSFTLKKKFCLKDFFLTTGFGISV